MPCDNCGHPVESEYVDARFMRHSGSPCTCEVCEDCGERYADDDPKAKLAHEYCESLSVP